MGELRKMINKKSQAEKELVISSASAENIKAEHEDQMMPYNPEFVKKILQGREDIKNGKGVSIDIQNLWM